MTEQRWLLPEGIEEVLPAEAARVETLRRELLDTYACWGYQMVIPPMIEYLDSLLTGTGHDLDLQTFKVTDQLSGRMMGIRADMTPQAARIDAHQLRQEGTTRLCYLGVVLHTVAEGFGGSRSPLQVGAELYGHAGLESDIEIISLMMETLAVASVQNVHLDLGHVAVFRSLARQAGLDKRQEQELFSALQRKSVPEIDEMLSGLTIEQSMKDMLQALTMLNGGVEILAEARERLAGAGDEVMQALDELQRIADAMSGRYPELPLYFDLAELRGYTFHTGLVFAAFLPGQGQEIARGGRYDNIGEVFGRARPATGFSTDLKTLISLSSEVTQVSTDAIAAPYSDDAALLAKVSELRAAGNTVVTILPGQEKNETGCSRQLVLEQGEWQVK